MDILFSITEAPPPRHATRRSEQWVGGDEKPPKGTERIIRENEWGRREQKYSELGRY